MALPSSFLSFRKLLIEKIAQMSMLPETIQRLYMPMRDSVVAQSTKGVGDLLVLYKMKQTL